MQRAVVLSVGLVIASALVALTIVLMNAPSQRAPVPLPTARPTPLEATPTPTQVPPEPSPTPDPFAVCQHDPANLPPLSTGTTFHTCGARILGVDGQPVQITGVSWFGME